MVHTDSSLADKQVICVQVLASIAVRLTALGLIVLVDETCVGWQSLAALSACHCSVGRWGLQAELVDLVLGLLCWKYGIQRITLVGRTHGAFGITISRAELLVIVVARWWLMFG
jgi:hypothetical protein